MAGRIAYYGNIVKDGLVLDLDAAKKDSYPGTGTVWRDISGNGYTGSLTNGPTFSSANGGFISFDGSNDYCITNYTDNPTYFTFECAFKFNTILGVKVIVGKYNGVGNDYWMGLSSGGNIVFSTNGTILNSNVVGSTSPYNIVTCVISSTAKEIYVNGALKNSTSTVSISPGGGIALATFGQAIAGFYSATDIASFKFYNRALSATEVTQNYNALKGRFGL